VARLSLRAILPQLPKVSHPILFSLAALFDASPSPAQLSVVMYGHALNGSQWSGVALVFAGLSLDIYAKYADRGHGKHKHGADKEVAVPLAKAGAKHN